jgi:hypothetical protein
MKEEMKTKLSYDTPLATFIKCSFTFLCLPFPFFPVISPVPPFPPSRRLDASNSKLCTVLVSVIELPVHDTVTTVI